MKLYRTAMSTIASAVLVGVFANPNPAIADGNCPAITGTVETQLMANPNWPTEEPFGSFTGTASVQIAGGQALTLSVTGQVTDVVIPAEDDLDASPTGTVSATFTLAGVGAFEAVGEVVVTLPETTDLDLVFPVAATLTISSGTGDFQGITGTVVSQGQNDFFTGVGTLELTGSICVVCDLGSCVAIPAVSVWGLVTMTLLVLAAGTIVLRRSRVVQT